MSEGKVLNRDEKNYFMKSLVIVKIHLVQFAQLHLFFKASTSAPLDFNWVTNEVAQLLLVLPFPPHIHIPYNSSQPRP
jgi:hypothetical protein